MKNIYCNTLEEASLLNERVTEECLSAGIWQGGTSNYCNPYQDTESGKWVVPILDGYEQFFKSYEIEYADMAQISAQLRTILKDEGFGRRLRSEIIEAVKDANMTNADRLTLFNKVKNGMDTLDYGDMQVSRLVFNSIATDTLYTAARKNWILGKIDAYLADL
jgi:hypothetical protein